ncbi:site-specific integrase [Psychrobacter sanguinis]|uniref:site-specific integrase n=1 Tax=Psychrobacter sanguinis TaxID=861445 RepID=UPI00191B4D32|nr:site-specific integrase [Psychrobacter sanguinis]UEC25543.1 site-specific integrase [Psychrobacter sanguinis]
MLKSIYPPKIVDGYAEPFGDPGYQLLVDEHHVSTARYEKYKHNVALQNMWDKCLRQQQTSYDDYEAKQKSLKSVKKYIKRFYEQFFIGAQLFTFVSQGFSCTSYHPWDRVVKTYLSDLNKKSQVLSPKSFEEFQAMVADDLKRHFSKGRRFETAFNRYVKFIDFINKNYLLKPSHYALPQINKPSRKNPLSIADSWVAESKYIHETIQLVVDYWGEKKRNSEEEIIASLIFSGIVYGGINDKDWLLPWLTQCLNNQLQPFVDYTLQTTIRYGSAKYGNERIEYESDSLKRQKLNSELFNSHQIIIDPISQCWLVRYYKLPTVKLNNCLSLNDIERLLKEFLETLLEPLSIPVPTLSQLLKSASYHWEILPGVKLNQALVSVLQGSIKTVGLLEDSFNNFMSAKYSYCTNPYSLHSNSYSLQRKNSKAHLPPSKVDYKKSDIVSFLKEQLEENLSKKYRYPTFIKSNATFNKLSILINEPIVLKNWFIYGIKKEISAQLITNRELYEKILVHWVIELLKESQKRQLKTINGYLGKVGNEWCYFMSLTQEDLTNWDEEDFIEFYDGLLEFKSVVRDNKAIDQPANLLQRIHNVGVKFYGFPAVTIEQAKMQVKVRAEWLSVQGYHSILRQIHYSAEPTERDMLMLLIVLTYRCGFRKKELLGIQIRDIEGLQLNEPSIIVRSNTYRELKNQSSKRRVPIYALLTPRELALFSRYVLSKIGQGSGTYLFSTMASKHPIDADVPLELLRTMMGYVGESRAITFHGLRHTAVTNLAILTSASPRLVTALTGYSEKDIKRALTGLNGVNHDGSDKWKALARVVGHLTPSRSFEFYYHAAALIATYELANADIKLPKRAFINITDIKSRALKDNKIVSDENGYVSIKSAVPWLYRQVTQPTQERRKPIKHNIMLSTLDDQTESEIFGVAISDTLLTRYAIHQVLTLLTTIEKSYLNPSPNAKDRVAKQTMLSGSSKAVIKPEDAEELYRRAKIISKISSSTLQKESYRFVTDKHKLLPMRIYEYIEHELMALMYKGFLKLREDCWKDYNWYLHIVAQRITSTHANISFPLKEFEELKRFVKDLVVVKNGCSQVT